MPDLAALQLYGEPIVCDNTSGIISPAGSLYRFILGNGNRRAETGCVGPFVNWNLLPRRLLPFPESGSLWRRQIVVDKTTHREYNAFMPAKI
jgi:hypothetical protein